MNRLVGIGEAAKALGAAVRTLRAWEAEGKLRVEHTAGGHRRYDLAMLLDGSGRTAPAPPTRRATLADARVCSNDQRADLDRQKQILELYCARQGWTIDLIADLGSGMNHHKKGLKHLLEMILRGHAERLVLTHRDRLLKFGAELVFDLCAAKGVEVIVLNRGEDTTFEEDLATDVLEIITVFSARLYGSRSHKNKTLLQSMREAVTAAAVAAVGASLDLQCLRH